MNATYAVFVNGAQVSSNLLSCSNSTHNYLCFNYAHSTHQVIIVPEFPSALFLLLVMVLLATAMIIIKKKRVK
ncbi:MAG: hypothetical protein QXM22_04195 [Candidatus Bathyarchaeia archaeon]